MTSIILAASAVTTTGLGATKSKGNNYSKGSNLVIIVDSIAGGSSISGYLQTSEDGTNFKDTCSIASIASTDVTASVKAFAARYEGALPQFCRIRWVVVGTVTASAKQILDD